MLTFLAQQTTDTGTRSPNFWMPKAASDIAEATDGLFYGILWITVFFTVLITVLMIFFAWKYRFREGMEPTSNSGHAGHSTTLEIIWTIIPTIIVLGIFFYGFRQFMNIAAPAPDAYEINVEAKMWQFTFEYPNGHRTNELHVPKDMPIRLVMSSVDVIHSVYIPAFRLKKDAVPGRFNKMAFTATEMPRNAEGGVGSYELFCTEYCGTGHSYMGAKVYVHETFEEFQAWLSQDSDLTKTLPLAEAGEALIGRNGCLQCHSIDGSRLVGPTFQNLWLREQQMSSGEVVVADENYILESIRYPGAKIVAGYPNQMAAYLRLSDSDIRAMIAYFKSISDTYDSGQDPEGIFAAPSAEGAEATEAEADSNAGQSSPAGDPSVEPGS
ncbi:MAG: cytochrome c oxidase subunit II [Phycisphaerae bacterium]